MKLGMGSSPQSMICVHGVALFMLRFLILKKSDDLSTCGYFMGFTKSRVLIYWMDPSTNQVKHAFNAALMSIGFA